MHTLRRLVGSFDRGVYHVERVLLLAALVMMTLLVFSDVIVRTFTRPVGKTASFLLFLLERAGPLDEELRHQVATRIGPALFLTAALLFVMFAVHSARHARHERGGRPAPALPASAGLGALVFLLLATAVWAVVNVFPTGVAGAQKFALGFMVWAGFLGASLATRARRHIVIDAVKKKLDPRLRPLFGALGGVATAGFTGLIAWLAAFKAGTLIREWHESDGMLHVFESLPVPEWVVTLALPVTFTLSALRFAAHGVAELLYGSPLASGPDAHGISLGPSADAGLPSPRAPEQDDAEPLYGVPHRGHEGRALPPEVRA